MKRLFITMITLTTISFTILANGSGNEIDSEKLMKAFELFQNYLINESNQSAQNHSLLITSVVALVSALIGAFIPSLFNYLGKKRDLKNEHQKKIYEEKLAVYKDYLQLIGDISVGVFNIPQNLEMLRRKSNLCLIYANNKLANAISEYYDFILYEYKDYNEQNKDSDIEKKNRAYQTKFLNLMREELGIEQEKLKTGLVPSV